MKRILSLLAIATSIVLFSCSGYDDTEIVNRVENLEDRVTALEELCQRMNSDIAALQTIVDALDKRDYITAVEEIEEGGVVVGYTISFAHSKTITIRHGKDGSDGENGKDGKDGANGEDGYTPQIGIKKDSDGIYYWTLDGKWLLDESGNKIKAEGQDGKDGADGKDGKDGKDGADGEDGTNGSNGEDGKDGIDGEDGKDGKDGITPQLKIDNGYWCISYDNGSTWTQLGKATGDNGADGADGDSFFRSVDNSNEEYVIFTLADGTEIKINKVTALSSVSISYIPKYSDGKATVYFQSKTNSSVELDFEVIPASATADIIANWENTISIKAVYTADTRNSSPFVNMPIISCTADSKSGTITITASGSELSDEFYANTQTASVRVSIIKEYYNVISDYIPMVAHLKTTEYTLATRYKTITEQEEIDLNIGGITPAVIDYGDGVLGIDTKHTYAKPGNYDVIYYVEEPITVIADKAFMQCTNLIDITLPDSLLAIDKSAFEGCTSLSQINIPGNVKYIYDRAFADCSNVSQIIINSSDTPLELIGFAFEDICAELYIDRDIETWWGHWNDGPFYNAAITKITIGENMYNINHSIFAYCKELQSIEYDGTPNLEYIGPYAFLGSNINGKVYIPKSLNCIDSSAFFNITGISGFEVEAGNATYSTGYNGELRCDSGKTIFRFPATTTSSQPYISTEQTDKLGAYSFVGSDIKSITYINQDKTIIIEDGAFWNCTDFSGFEPFNDNHKIIISAIGDGVFGYTAIESLNLYNSTFGSISGTFRSCEQLRVLHLPPTIFDIGDRSFEDCGKLVELYIPATNPPLLSDAAFNIVNSDLRIFVPADSADDYEAAEGWSNFNIVAYDFENDVVVE